MRKLFAIALFVVCGLCAAQSAFSADKPEIAVRLQFTEHGGKVTGHGTAFGVDLQAYGHYGRHTLLTAAHNVIENGQIHEGLAVEIDGKWSPCKVGPIDANLDICLIYAADEVPVTVVADRDACCGSIVVLIGSPRGRIVTRYHGRCINRWHHGSCRSRCRVEFDHGCSGAPLLSEDGKVVGVAVAGEPKDGDIDHEFGLFVPACCIASFLTENLGGK